MASTEEETEVKETIETDISDLTVKTESIIDRSKKEKKSQGPSRIVVILKWLTTLTFAAVLLSCLVTSKITVIGLAQHLTESSTSKYQAFTMCLIILLAPNVISFSRSLWNIIGRSDIPWPNKKSIFLVIISAASESAGLSLVIFKALNTGQAASGVTAMEIGIFIPIFYFIKKNNRGMKFFRGLSVIAVLFAIAGASLDILLHIKYAVNTWSLCGYVLIYLSWFPYLNKHIFPPVMTTVRGPLNANGQTSRISINRPNSSASLPGVSSCSNLPSYNSTANTSGISSHLCDKTSPWKVLFISAFSKIVFILSSSALLIKFAMDDLSFDDGWTKGWTWSTSDDVFVLFIVHTTISIVGYAIAVFACHTCMDRGSFVIPLILSSPVAYIILAVPRSCEWIQNFSGNSQAFCVKDTSLIYSLIAMLCFFITISLTFGRLLWDIQNIVLQKEIQLFWHPAYNSVMLEQWLLLNRKLNDDMEEGSNQINRNTEKTRVYICTTMYRESRHEMQQLLESIRNISQATSKSSQIHFESHVFLDGAIKGEEMTDYALQLLSLLKDALNIDDLKTCTKTSTPYGLKFGWKLPGPSKMTFIIHMKDPKKVKKKKRWSQIMYMSYVLDFLRKQHLDGESNCTVSESDCFILTTDADVKFTPESVEALLDFMKRDSSVGAVCARTYPIGKGPLVWYQKFEYAIGHWFQKAAEHVLGSVLCAPGCFSVYRCSAIKSILPNYASDVERAFEFLIKDMGEDRWLCTLMVQSGWRIEYCAASKNETYCPDEFEEFYKQRRRWIASTLANIISLIEEWNLIRSLNHRVPFLFCIYQMFLLVSTVIGPSTVIIIVAGGLNYAWNVDLILAVVLQVVVCVIYAWVCLYTEEKWQMQFGKVITFLYAVVMTAVVVGIVEQVAEDLISLNDKVKVETKDGKTVTVQPTVGPGAISDDFPVSVVTLYLGLLIAIFLVSGAFHPTEIACLLHGFTYLLCLPSGYLVLNIYSVVNITDRSWGTREEKLHDTVKDNKPWYDKLETAMRKIFFCFEKKEPSPPTTEPETDVPQSDSHDQNEALFPGDFSKTVGPGFRYKGSPLYTSLPDDRGRDAARRARPDYLESMLETDFKKENFEREEEFHENNLLDVRTWLPFGMKGYARNFVENGYENTNFLGMLTEKDLKQIGIKKVAHRRKLFRLIQDIPEFKIPIGVPNDVHSWLSGIGLLQYEQNFNRNQIKTVQDMEVLKTITKKEIKEDLKIIKSGHIQRLLDAIACLRQPAKEERIITEIKKQIGQVHNLKDLGSVNREENKFWVDLIKTCLAPSADVFSLEQTLKKNLRTLRNEWLMVSGIVNCLWIVIIMTLSSSIDLNVAGTNILSLLFLIVFGFLFVLQFICMLLHRFTTLSHFIARAPYRFGQNYRTSFAFLSRDLEPDANHLDRKPSLDDHYEASENTSLLSDHGNDVYQRRLHARPYQSV